MPHQLSPPSSTLWLSYPSLLAGRAGLATGIATRCLAGSPLQLLFFQTTTNSVLFYYYRAEARPQAPEPEPEPNAELEPETAPENENEQDNAPQQRPRNLPKEANDSLRDKGGVNPPFP